MSTLKLSKVLNVLENLRDEEVKMLKEQALTECIEKYDLNTKYLNWYHAMCDLVSLKELGFKFDNINLKITKKTVKSFPVDIDNLSYENFVKYAWMVLHRKKDSPCKQFELDAELVRLKWKSVIDSIKDCVEFNSKELVISDSLNLPVLLKANGIDSDLVYKRLGIIE